MLAYHNEPRLKAAAVARMRGHRELDVLCRGHGYWGLFGHYGCAVGCMVAEAIGFRVTDATSKLHNAYPRLLGLPVMFAHLEEAYFERAILRHNYTAPPQSDGVGIVFNYDDEIGRWTLAWPERFLEAIPVGVDLTEFEGWEDGDDLPWEPSGAWAARAADAGTRAGGFNLTLMQDGENLLDHLRSLAPSERVEPEPLAAEALLALA